MNLAYLAGFVDGEGCMRFGRTRSSVFPVVLVTNTYLPILTDIKEKFGGDIRPLALRKSGWKQGYNLRISWTAAVDLISAVYPFLRVKRAQAQTIFAWDAIRVGSGKQTASARQEYLDAVDLLAARMTWLNQKGPVLGTGPVDIVLHDMNKKKGR